MLEIPPPLSFGRVGRLYNTTLLKNYTTIYDPICHRDIRPLERTAYDAGALHPPVSSQANVRMTFLEIILSFWTNLISWFTIGPHLKFDMDNQGPRFSCEFIVGIPILLAIVFFLYKSFSYVSNFVLSLSTTLLDTISHLQTIARTPWEELPNLFSTLNKATTILNKTFEAID